MTHDEFQKRMEEKHPHMFSGRYGGFAVGEGWYPIIESLCANIEYHIAHVRHCRARDLLLDRARDKGIDHVIKFLAGGKPVRDWHQEDAERVMKVPHAIKEYVPRVKVAQIKEKFGGLRFYYDGGDDVVYGMVTMTESWASRTCETCGAKGHQRGGGWVRTLCDEHEAEYQKRKNS